MFVRDSLVCITSPGFSLNDTKYKIKSQDCFASASFVVCYVPQLCSQQWESVTTEGEEAAASDAGGPWVIWVEGS